MEGHLDSFPLSSVFIPTSSPAPPALFTFVISPERCLRVAADQPWASLHCPYVTMLPLLSQSVWYYSSVTVVITMPVLLFCVAVQSFSHVSLQPHGLQHARLSLSFTISWSLLKLMSIESVMPSNHLVLCCPSDPSPAFSLSQHQGLFQ